LLRVGKLTLLKNLFDRIFIPEEVHRELCGWKRGFKELKRANFFEVRKVKNKRFLITC
jgi:predicted nucleic acid-binding protein